MKKHWRAFLLLLAVTLILYLPIFVKPSIVLERDNDLEEFFWPTFHFVKQQIIQNRALPLWNNVFFSGTPLLPDPQSPLFYLPNVIFLFLPIGIGFLTSFFLHTLAAGIGMYFAAKEGFKFSKAASVFAAAIYILSPKLAGYLEAGHFGLITAWTFLPFIILSLIKLAKSPNYKWAIALSVSLVGLYYSHLLTFLITAIFSIPVFLVLLNNYNSKNQKKSVAHYLLGAAIAIGLVSISLLPQLAWKDQTTRSLLLNERDVYPKWTSKLEFANSATAPWIDGPTTIQQIDTEKVIALGLFTAIFAFFGFLKLKRKNKVLILIFITTLALIALNNASPLHQFLLTLDTYVLTRVSTRAWILALISGIFLAAYGFNHLQKSRKKLSYLLAFLAVIELLFLSWTRILKPIPEQSKYASKEIISLISSDKDIYRVFCLNRCISQKDAAENGLELVEGYGTLQQTNYYQHFIQLSQSYFDRYSLALPPFEIYNFQELQPHAPTLGAFNVKYIVSPHKLTDTGLILNKELDGYFVYQNSLFQPRSNAPISIYTPNHIRIDTTGFEGSEIVLSEVYNPDWQAYLDGQEKIEVIQYSKIMRAVSIKPDTKYVDIKYEPESYKWGKIITITTVLTLVTGTCYICAKEDP